ncbi:hypothetical protein TDIS_1045 [Thermosulfurimonas dismutans]|uniref:Big-1 domain-containing protein n=1 Tax=Thermosulfurimonas dismutans TaxID=999894 RepID=A0A179D5P2_9BACT|nr:hypothetical protein TDIS_1045 [Thermosulfurimonas dismutans]
MWLWVFVLPLLLVACGGGGGGGGEETSGTTSGATVVGSVSKDPVANATVWLLCDGKKLKKLGQTDGEGNFQFKLNPVEVANCTRLTLKSENGTMQVGNDTLAAPPLQGFIMDEDGNVVHKGADIISGALYYAFLTVDTSALVEKHSDNFTQIENDPEFEPVRTLVYHVRERAREEFGSEREEYIKKLFTEHHFSIRDYEPPYNRVLADAISRLLQIQTDFLSLWEKLLQGFVALLQDLQDGVMDGQVNGNPISGNYTNILDQIGSTLQNYCSYAVGLSGDRIIISSDGQVCSKLTAKIAGVIGCGEGPQISEIAFDAMPVGNATNGTLAINPNPVQGNTLTEASAQVCAGSAPAGSVFRITAVTSDNRTSNPVLIKVCNADSVDEISMAGIYFDQTTNQWKVKAMVAPLSGNGTPSGKVTFKIVKGQVTFTGGKKEIEVDIDTDGYAVAPLEVQGAGMAKLVALVEDPCTGIHRRVAMSYVAPDPCAVKAVSLNATPISVVAGESANLTAQVEVVNPDICADLSGKQVTFEVVSGDGTVNPATTVTDASGNASTTLTANAPGEIKVKATSEGKTSNEVTIQVAEHPCTVTGVTLSANKTSLTAGDSTQLMAQVQVVNAEQCGDLSGKEVTFEVVSGDGYVNPPTAQTDATGKASTTLTVNAPGEVKVKATSEGKTSNEVAIQVAQDPCTVTGIDVRAEPATVCAGGNSTIKATIHLADFDSCTNKDAIGDAAFEVTQGDGVLSQVSIPIGWNDVDKVGVAAVTLTAGSQNSTVRVTVDGVSGQTSVGVTQPKAYTCTLKLGVTANGTIGGVDVTVDYPETALGFDNVVAIGAAQGGLVVPNDNGTHVKIGLISAGGFPADGSAVLKLTFSTPQNQGLCSEPQESELAIIPDGNATCSDLSGNTFACPAQIVEFTCQ